MVNIWSLNIEISSPDKENHLAWSVKCIPSPESVRHTTPTYDGSPPPPPGWVSNRTGPVGRVETRILH